MTEAPEWKKALKESNAIGWIAFIVLVFAIGFGTVYFGTDTSGSNVTTTSSSASN